MKIKIAYTAGEVDKALKLTRACLAFFPKDTKTKHSARHKPYLHIYIADDADGRSSKRGSGSRTGSKTKNTQKEPKERK